MKITATHDPHDDNQQLFALDAGTWFYFTDGAERVGPLVATSEIDDSDEDPFRVCIVLATGVRLYLMDKPVSVAITFSQDKLPAPAASPALQDPRTDEHNLFDLPDGAFFFTTSFEGRIGPLLATDEFNDRQIDDDRVRLRTCYDLASGILHEIDNAKVSHCGERADTCTTQENANVSEAKPDPQTVSPAPDLSGPAHAN